MLVVSLTTIRSRLDLVGRALKSIRRGSRTPDRIVLSISREPYLLDEGVADQDLPDTLIRLRDAGKLEIQSVPNTGPYRKLFPLAASLPSDAIVVTADDDRRYPVGWLDGLVRAHERSGRQICFRARRIAVRHGALRPYAKWKTIKDDDGEASGQVRAESVHMLTLPIGCWGVLYRADWCRNLSLLDELRALAPRNDDLAFRGLLLAQGIEAERIPYIGEADDPGFRSAGKVTTGLFDENADVNRDAFAAILDLLERRGLFRLSDHLEPEPAAA